MQIGKAGTVWKNIYTVLQMRNVKKPFQIQGLIIWIEKEKFQLKVAPGGQNEVTDWVGQSLHLNFKVLRHFVLFAKQFVS